MADSKAAEKAREMSLLFAVEFWENWKLYKHGWDEPNDADALPTAVVAIVETLIELAQKRSEELEALRVERDAAKALAEKRLANSNILYDDHLSEDDIGETGDGGLYIEEDHNGWRRSVAFAPAALAVLKRALAAHSAEVEALRADRDALDAELNSPEAEAKAVRREVEAERDEARATVVRLEGELAEAVKKADAFLSSPVPAVPPARCPIATGCTETGPHEHEVREATAEDLAAAVANDSLGG